MKLLYIEPRYYWDGFTVSVCNQHWGQLSLLASAEWEMSRGQSAAGEWEQESSSICGLTCGWQVKLCDLTVHFEDEYCTHYKSLYYNNNHCFTAIIQVNLR